jgi:hypothetical protein
MAGRAPETATLPWRELQGLPAALYVAKGAC